MSASAFSASSLILNKSTAKTGTVKPPSTAAPAISRWDYQLRLLAWMATCVSVFSFLFYYRNGDVLLYGDAVAHINIARRVFDSRTPSLLQLGTVWLPLPHLLMLPFLVSNKLWRSGAGGSIPSLVAYVLGVVGTFRLGRALLRCDDPTAMPHGAQRKEKLPAPSLSLAPWIAAGIYAANPNLIYMQTTAMGEALYLALFVWVVVFFAEFLRGESKALTKCAFCLAAASLTRYDGWFLSAITIAFAVAALISPSLLRMDREENQGAVISRVAVIRFVLIAASGPALWLAYNAAVYRNPLEFANGPYSAKAIEQKTGTINPAKGDLFAAESYFAKSAELNVAAPDWLGRLWLALSFAGLVAAMWMRRWPVLLLWTPLPFYALSIAYGAVPIFIPPWWPHSQYNVRYGLELLPAFAVSLASLVHFVLRRIADKHKPSMNLNRFRPAIVLAVLAIVVGGYSSVWATDPICFREADINSRSRAALESQLAKWIVALPYNSTLLMNTGGHSGVLEQIGFPLRRTINEGNHRVWKQPSDPEGLWERTLAHPAEFADFALAFEGDDVYKALEGRGYRELVEIETSGQPRAVLFQLR